MQDMDITAWLNPYMDGQGHLVMPKICIGTGVGDYKHYVERRNARMTSMVLGR